MFSFEFYEIFKNTFFTEHLQNTELLNNSVYQDVSNSKNVLAKFSLVSDIIFSSLRRKKQKNKGWIQTLDSVSS